MATAKRPEGLAAFDGLPADEAEGLDFRDEGDLGISVPIGNPNAIEPAAQSPAAGIEANGAQLAPAQPVEPVVEPLQEVVEPIVVSELVDDRPAPTTTPGAGSEVDADDVPFRMKSDDEEVAPVEPAPVVEAVAAEPTPESDSGRDFFQDLDDAQELADIGAQRQPQAAIDAGSAAPAPAGERRNAERPNMAGDAPKALLDIRGFYIASGEGIYDGATRDNEEPRESHWIDVQDYDTGEITRYWGVALREELEQAKQSINLGPGSRIHLLQQGKREMIVSEVNDRQEMENRRTFANAWTCLPDRGPLPSQLAHLMAGINVDGALNRIALRHDMGLDDPRLAGWKQEQLRILRAFGEDPQTVQGWLSRQLTFGQEEERKLVTRAVELAGYADDEPERKEQEIAHRLAAIREMDAEARFDYLIAGAKPQLVEANRVRESKLQRDVVDAIDQLAAMASQNASPDSTERKAIRSALIQSVDGLTPTQQMEYLGQRRARLVQHITSPAYLAAQTAAPAGEVDRLAVIDASSMTPEEYRAKLEEKLALAKNGEERARMLAEETEARKKDSKIADDRLAPLQALYQKIASERDVDMLAHLTSTAVGALLGVMAQGIKMGWDTTFKGLGGLGAWRRHGCENGLGDLQQALSAAKASGVYQAFERDPAVAEACGGRSVAEVLRESPQIARTEVAMDHIAAQEKADPPRGAGKGPVTGLWAGVMKSAHSLADRVSHLAPEHLVKRDGQVDGEWVKSMQQGLASFAQDLKGTLMPERVRQQLEELVASITNAIKVLLDILMARGASKDASKQSDPAGIER